MSKYWKQVLPEIFDDAGVTITDEQKKKLVQAIEDSANLQDFYTGVDVADQNFKEQQLADEYMNGAKAVLDKLSRYISQFDAGTDICFRFMSHEQKMALGGIVNMNASSFITPKESK